MVEACICTALRQAAAQSTSHYDAMLAPAGVKVTMFRLLRRINDATNLSISALAADVGLDRSTLGRNLRVLERQSLIKMSVGEDGRKRMISLTDMGRVTLVAAAPLWRRAQADYAQMIGADTMALLERLAAHEVGRQI